MLLFADNKLSAHSRGKFSMQLWLKIRPFSWKTKEKLNPLKVTGSGTTIWIICLDFSNKNTGV